VNELPRHVTCRLREISSKASKLLSLLKSFFEALIMPLITLSSKSMRPIPVLSKGKDLSHVLRTISDV
jgi:hypothetical protein